MMSQRFNVFQKFRFFDMEKVISKTGSISVPKKWGGGIGMILKDFMLLIYYLTTYLWDEIPGDL